MRRSPRPRLTIGAATAALALLGAFAPAPAAPAAAAPVAPSSSSASVAPLDARPLVAAAPATTEVSAATTATSAAKTITAKVSAAKTITAKVSASKKSARTAKKAKKSSGRIIEKTSTYTRYAATSPFTGKAFYSSVGTTWLAFTSNRWVYVGPLTGSYPRCTKKTYSAKTGKGCAPYLFTKLKNSSGVSYQTTVQLSKKTTLYSQHSRTPAQLKKTDMVGFSHSRSPSSTVYYYRSTSVKRAHRFDNQWKTQPGVRPAQYLSLLADGRFVLSGRWDRNQEGTYDRAPLATVYERAAAGERGTYSIGARGTVTFRYQSGRTTTSHIGVRYGDRSSATAPYGLVIGTTEWSVIP